MVESQEQEIIRQRLLELETEHRDLDDVIERLSDNSVVDQIQIRRLKKRKLQLKDQISRLQSRLYPNIIA
ncbi:MULTISPECIES: YdcH family protein [Limibacillus]|uniref:DUF465 domain-containing protein n=1 Tax=Limibacillus halophilus TaxID=1579333 RepID=A0A839SZ20_9PROT|nr:YdcH family protein [Limibacillus halophilus]MBB3066846.1 hypothetical protein [Limibacillus halophilus]